MNELVAQHVSIDFILALHAYTFLSATKETTFNEEIRRLNKLLFESEEKSKALELDIDSKSSQLQQLLKEKELSERNLEQTIETDRKTDEEHVQQNGDCNENSKVRQLETLLEDSLNTIDILERKNTEFSQQLEVARSEIEEGFDGDDLRSLQARKIVRLGKWLSLANPQIAYGEVHIL